MNKKKFVELLEQPENIDAKDRDVLLQLLAEYPYAQSLHALVAKGSKNLGLDELSDDVSKAALTTSYRPVLKALIEGVPLPAPEPEPEPVPVDETPEPEPEESPVQEEQTPEPAAVEPEPNVITFELKEDKNKPESYEIDDLLKSLRQNKKAYDDDDQDRNAQREQAAEEPQTHLAHHYDDAPLSDEEKSRQLIQELENKNQHSQVDDKVKQQQQIIDRFIASEPELSQKPDATSKDSDQNEVDLAADSTSNADSFISENLANILLKQGKVDKAIDIYKKLIWKFPQKKAYFADRIRDLKQE